MLQREEWMFVALILGGAIIPTNDFAPHSWTQYLSYVLVLSLLLSPSIIFIANKKRLELRLREQRLNRVVFYGLWVMAFFIYPLLLGLYVQEFQPLQSILPYENEALIIMGALFFWLAVFLELNQLFYTKIKNSRWLRQLSLGKIFFLLMIASVLFMTFFSISSLDKFYEKQQIDIALDFPQILRHIPEFLGIGFQFLLLYSIGYLFYLINQHILIGKLLKQKGILHYVMGVLASIVLLYPILAQLIIWLPLHQDIQVLAPSQNFLAFDYLNGSVPFIIMVVSLPVILVFQWFQQNNQILSLEKQQVQTELDLLKQQINPHFFFNTLNNLYGLSQKQSEQTPEVILQLSELMRYVIYRGKEQRVKIKEEINYLQDYSSLQKIRLHKTLDYQFRIDVEDDEVEIPPLLLVVLVENAFKHGIEPAEHMAFLHIHLTSKKEEIHFVCENSFEGPTTSPGGVGLENLRRRLDLLFGKDYTLKLETKDAIFKVQLSWKRR